MSAEGRGRGRGARRLALPGGAEGRRVRDTGQQAAVVCRRSWRAHRSSPRKARTVSPTVRCRFSELSSLGRRTDSSGQPRMRCGVGLGATRRTRGLLAADTLEHELRGCGLAIWGVPGARPFRVLCVSDWREGCLPRCNVQRPTRRGVPAQCSASRLRLPVLEPAILRLCARSPAESFVGCLCPARWLRLCRRPAALCDALVSARTLVGGSQSSPSSSSSGAIVALVLSLPCCELRSASSDNAVALGKNGSSRLSRRRACRERDRAARCSSSFLRSARAADGLDRLGCWFAPSRPRLLGRVHRPSVERGAWCRDQVGPNRCRGPRRAAPLLRLHPRDVLVMECHNTLRTAARSSPRCRAALPLHDLATPSCAAIFSEAARSGAFWHHRRAASARVGAARLALARRSPGCARDS